MIAAEAFADKLLQLDSGLDGGIVVIVNCMDVHV